MAGTPAAQGRWRAAPGVTLWRFGFSCICAAWVPDAPAVAAAPVCLCLVPRWHRVRCDLSAVIWGVASFLAPRAVWLACVGRLTFLVHVCL